MRSLISDITNNKFKVSQGNKHFKFTSKILDDYRYKDFKNFLDDIYVKQGYGIKYLIKH